MATVLLIDDDNDLIEGYKLALEQSGFTVHGAVTGREGWGVLERVKPDIVILDCMIEDFTTGFELAHDIGVKYPHMPVIILSSIQKEMSPDWEFGPKDKEWLPVHKFIRKPLSPKDLIREIEAVLPKS